MSENMQQEIQQLKQLLLTTYTGTSTDQIKLAECEIQKATNHPDFLKYLIEILRDSSLNQINAKFDVIQHKYTQKYIKKMSNIFNQIYLILIIQQISKNLLQTMYTSLSGILLIYKDSIKMFRPRQLNNQYLLQEMNKQQLNQNKQLSKVQASFFAMIDNQLSSTFIILQTVIVSIQKKDLLFNFFRLLNIPFCQIGSKYLQEVTYSLQKIDSQQNDTESQKIFQDTIEKLKVLNLWVNVLKDLVQSVMDSKKVELIQLVLENDILASLICHGICVTLNTPEQIKDCFICTSGKELFDNYANILKAQLLKTYTRINRQMFSERSKIDLFKTNFFKLLEQSLPIVLKGLILFCQSTPTFQKNLENQALASIVIECLKFSHVCAEQSEFYKMFQDCSRILLLEVIFPLMRSSESEQESLENNPEEFVRLALDTCDRQISYSYKCAAAKLLETVCDYIDGFETIVSLLLLQIIGFSIKFENLNDIDEKYPTLLSFKNTVFMSRTERFIRVETCLVALSVLSYLTPKRPDIVSQIELLLKEHATFLFNPQIQRLIKSRVCLMVGYYSDSIFQKEPENYKSIINFLLSCLTLTEQEDQGIVYQAIDSLQNVYDDDKQVNLNGKNINDVLQVILPLITKIEQNQFMDIIQHIFRFHGSKITKENIVTCVNYLVQRIINEVNMLEQKTRTDQIFINKCWNIVRDMSENKSIVPQYINDILEQLKPLLQCLQYPDKIEFDEDIILLVGSFIKHQKTVNPICGDLITCFPLILKKQFNIFGQIFNAINNLIMFGQTFLIQNIGHLQLIVKMSFDVMFGDNKKSSDSDKAEGATVLQLIIQTLGEHLPDEVWKYIFNAAIQRFQNQQKLKHIFVYGRTAGIFLSGFVSNLSKSAQILTDMGILEQVVNLCIEKLDIYKRNYDMKLFIMSMSYLMVNISFDANKLLKIFDCLVSLMMKQKELELKLLNKKKSTEQSKDSDDEDDEEDNEDDEFDDEEEFEDDENDPESDYDKEYDCSVASDKMMLKYMISPVNQQDEFSIFKSSYTTMKTQNYGALQQLISGLNKEKQDYLKQLLNVQRVAVGGEQVIRVIHQIKRKNQQTAQ